MRGHYIFSAQGAPSVVEVCGIVGLDIRRCGGRLLQSVQDLGIEGRGHLVAHITPPVLPEFPTSLNGVLHCHHQRD